MRIGLHEPLASRWGRGLRAAAPALAVIVAAAAMTVTAVAVPPVAAWSHPAHDLRIALETLLAVLTALAGTLLLLRGHDTGEATHGLLGVGLWLIALGYLATWTLPLDDPTAAWTVTDASLVSLRPLGIAVLAIAAWAPHREAPSTRWWVLSLPVVATAVLLAAHTTVLLAWASPTGTIAAPSWPLGFAPHPRWQAVLLVSAVLAGVAAAGLWRRVGHRRRGLLAWTAAGLTVLAAAQLQVSFVPSSLTDTLHAVDVTRLAATVLLLIAAAHEIPDYARRATVRQLARERRRIAHDLHDGVAQEVAFIRREVHLFATESMTASLEAIDAAAARANDEARFALASLSSRPGAPLHLRLRAITRDVARRFNADVVIDAPDDLEVGDEVADALLRLAREAVTNAVRHGGARCIHITLRMALGAGDGARHGPHLTVTDDGCGFDVENATLGFGLSGMRERAAALGASLEIRSGQGGGTTVEVRP